MPLRDCSASSAAALAFGLRPVPDSRPMHVQRCADSSYSAEAVDDGHGRIKRHADDCSDNRSLVKSPYKQRT